MLPGTTHTQPAQPVLFGHHLLAYAEMAERDRGRLADARRRLNVSPLGSGALAGAGYPLDREATAAELGFDGVTANSLDAVGDRDFVVETLAAVALGMVHLSRLAEEIAWWSNPRFGYVRVAEAYATGSSMMPNKRNPDPAELVRGRSAAAIAAVTAVLGLLKGLPLGYQRDLQEDKPPLFGAVAAYEASLAVMAGLVATLAVNRRGDGGRGGGRLPDRDDARRRARPAWRAIPRRPPGRRGARRTGRAGRDPAARRPATVGRRRRAPCRRRSDRAGRSRTSPAPPEALLAAATIEGSLAAADVIGGTAPARVRAAIAAARARLDGAGPDLTAGAARVGGTVRNHPQRSSGVRPMTDAIAAGDRGSRDRRTSIGGH